MCAALLAEPHIFCVRNPDSQDVPLKFVIILTPSDSQDDTLGPVMIIAPSQFITDLLCVLLSVNHTLPSHSHRKHQTPCDRLGDNTAPLSLLQDLVMAHSTGHSDNNQ